MPKVALLCYHKNIFKLYPEEWIKEYKQSILWQTYVEFSIFEINYGGGVERIFENSHFESVEMPTFIHALNYLLDKCYSGGYDCICNSNVDDIFDISRLEKQIPFIKAGYDIVSSNFHRIFEGHPFDNEFLMFDKADIKKELEADHNVVGHPGVCYSRNFIKHNRYVPEDQPYEDIRLWKKTIDNFKFIILPEILFTHRVHDNSVCRSENK